MDDWDEDVVKQCEVRHEDEQIASTTRAVSLETIMAVSSAALVAAAAAFFMQG
jgi:hypothetical protein